MEQHLKYLVHEFACMKTQTIEKHLFAEDVHFLNSDEEGSHTGPNYSAGQRSNDNKAGIWLLFNQLSLFRSISSLYKGQILQQL